MSQKAIKKFLQLINDYEIGIQDELVERWNKLSIDVEQQELYEVIFGILSNQMTITIHFIRSTHCWNYAVAPILMRTISEHFINLSWILKGESLNRARMFIEYGQGQEKLMIEHYKAEAEIQNDDNMRGMASEMEDGLSQERYTFLTDVNLGSWSSKSVREIATEAGCDDNYRFVYSQYSHATHGTWNHIWKVALEHSKNPLHRGIRLPVFQDFKPDIYICQQMMKYMQQSLNLVDSFLHLNIDESKSSLKKFDDGLSIIGKLKDDESTSTDKQ